MKTLNEIFPDLSIVDVSVFWKNDKPEGFGVAMSKETAHIFASMAIATYHLLRREADFEKFLSEEAPVQLEHAAKFFNEHGRSIDTMSKEDAAHFMIFGPVNVYILEQERRFTPDEFNGCVFAYTTEPKEGV